MVPNTGYLGSIRGYMEGSRKTCLDEAKDR